MIARAKGTVSDCPAGGNDRLAIGDVELGDVKGTLATAVNAVSRQRRATDASSSAQSFIERERLDFADSDSAEIRMHWIDDNIALKRVHYARSS